MTPEENTIVPLPMPDVLTAVAKFYNIDPRFVRGPSRRRSASYPRQVFMYLARKFCRRTLVEIARFLSRDHATVMYGIETVAQCVALGPANSVRAAEVDWLVKHMEPRVIAVA